jgi:hypothetical protein
MGRSGGSEAETQREARRPGVQGGRRAGSRDKNRRGTGGKERREEGRGINMSHKLGLRVWCVRKAEPRKKRGDRSWGQSDSIGDYSNRHATRPPTSGPSPWGLLWHQRPKNHALKVALFGHRVLHWFAWSSLFYYWIRRLFTHKKLTYNTFSYNFSDK